MLETTPPAVEGDAGAPAARDIQAEILAALTENDAHPDPDGEATALCANCTFPVVERAISTGRQFTGPFWRDAWVHTDSGETRCWGTFARPDVTPPGSRSGAPAL